MAITTARNDDHKTAERKHFDTEEYASKLDEIGNKLPNLVGDHNALIAYAAELKGLAQRVRNPEDVKANPSGQPDVRPSQKDINPDGQDLAMKPGYRLEHDENAPQHLPVAKPNPATAAVYAQDERQANNEQAVVDKTKYGTGSDTQKSPAKPGK